MRLIARAPIENYVGGDQRPGDVFECEDSKITQELIDAGRAEELGDDGVVKPTADAANRKIAAAAKIKDNKAEMDRLDAENKATEQAEARAASMTAKGKRPVPVIGEQKGLDAHTASEQEAKARADGQPKPV